MTFSKKSNAKSQSQLERFQEAARQLETDNDEERFEERLKRIVKQKPDCDKQSD